MMELIPTNEPMGIPGEWKPAWRVTAPLVIAKDQSGRLRHCYQGSLLGWLGDEQAKHFLRLGLVERIEDSNEAPQLPAAGAVAECLAALAQLGIPPKAGAPTARNALREAGHKFANEVVAAAVKDRKRMAFRQAGDDEEFEEIIA